MRVKMKCVSRSWLVVLIIGLGLWLLGETPVGAAVPCPGSCVNNINATNQCSRGYEEDTTYDCGTAPNFVCCIPVLSCLGECYLGDTCSSSNPVKSSRGNRYCQIELGEYVNPVSCCLPSEGAATEFNCSDPNIGNPLLVPKCAVEQLGRLAAFIMEMATLVAVVVAVIFIILGGFKYITSQDNSERLEKARMQILWAVVGLVISASVFILVRYLSSGLQIPIFGSVTNRVYAQESVVVSIQISGKATDSVSLQQLKGVDVTLYVKDGVGWQVWPGKDYNNQRNPQKVSEFGEYTYLVPQGEYYVRASLFGYHSFKSEPVMATDRPIRIDVSLEPAPTFWNIVVGIGVVVLVVLVLYVGIKAVVVWQKKRTIKALVLKSVRERELTGKTDVSADTNNL